MNYLECILCVLDAVDADVVVDSERNARREDGQSQYLSSTTIQRTRLASQHEASQRIRHHVTLIGVYLDVDRCVDCLVTQRAHRLYNKRTHSAYNNVSNIYMAPFK